MDPVQKIWMFNNWIEDKSEEYELSKHNAYTTASFTNPEGVHKMVSDEGKYESTEEEFEESTMLMKQHNKIQEDLAKSKLLKNAGSLKKKKRKILLREE